MFGSRRYDIEPDVVSIAKGLTPAYLLFSGAIVCEKVYCVLEEVSPGVGLINHGHRRSGHPIWVAANAAR
jgi:L-2,4-diaminobutyrate transaminase